MQECRNACRVGLGWRLRAQRNVGQLGAAAEHERLERGARSRYRAHAGVADVPAALERELFVRSTSRLRDGRHTCDSLRFPLSESSAAVVEGLCALRERRTLRSSVHESASCKSGGSPSFKYERSNSTSCVHERHICPRHRVVAVAAICDEGACAKSTAQIAPSPIFAQEESPPA